MEEIELKGIKNIIFDLGNVVINLQMDATWDQFKVLCGSRYESIMNGLNEQQFFERYETGMMSTEEFVQTLQTEIDGNVSEKEITEAWNKMLLDIPDRRFEILSWAKKNYRTFCLSNTNDLHIRYIYAMLKKTKHIDNLNSYFEQVYLSHEMGMRKPNLDIFEEVLQKQQLQPSETLFIDDTAGHLQGANKLGIRTFHLQKGMELESLFEKGMNTQA